jgi:hypothetical protein
MLHLMDYYVELNICNTLSCDHVLLAAPNLCYSRTTLLVVNASLNHLLELVRC